MALITCKNLTLSYETGVAVTNVSFEVCAGDYICVAGENGSGKSTLIKGMLGLMPPKSGEIVYHGIRLNEIGYLPQQTLIQKNFPASVYEVVLSGCSGRLGSRLFYAKAERERALQNLERMGVLDLKKHCYRALSNGQQQRVLLARALCATSRLLLLDEPLTALDPLATEELYALIKRLNREDKITIIMISHDVSCALHDAGKVLHMGAMGELVFFGTSDEYRHSDIGSRFLRCACSCHEREDHHA